jgi:hypothetical protein
MTRMELEGSGVSAEAGAWQPSARKAAKILNIEFVFMVKPEKEALALPAKRRGLGRNFVASHETSPIARIFQGLSGG